MHPCYLCKSIKRDTIKYGQFLTRRKISVHYFCLLLTSNLLQKGHDKEGFLGFLLEDIKAEADRVAPAECCYCKKKSANISCCATKCYKSFHLICGIENDSLNQFEGTFKSFCNRHVPGQKIRPRLAGEICSICYENIIGERERFSAVNHLQAPCCRNGWFHKSCLASFADSAGYFFKCPLCNDNKLFRERLTKKGIFIPDKDAAWELERNAYSELLHRPTNCSASSCSERRIRKNKRSQLIYCATCGSIAIHRKCMKNQNSSFHCDECTSFISTLGNESLCNISSNTQINDANKEDEDEYVEVCEEDEYNDSICQNNSQQQDLKEEVESKKATDHRDFDEQMTSIDDHGDCASSLIVRQKAQRINSPKLSSNAKDSIESVDVQRQHSNAGDAESLFDSGAETDRSANSGDKFNLNNSFSVSESFSPQKSEYERSQNCCSDEVDTMESLPSYTSYSSENPGYDFDILPQNEKQKSRAAKRFTSLNDSPSGSACTSKRTRQVSMCTEVALSSFTAKEDAKSESGEIKMDQDEFCCKQMTQNGTDSICSIWNSTEFENSPTTTRSRARTHSDDQSIVQSTFRCESSKTLSSATNKRSRSDSMPDTDVSQNKRLKSSSIWANREKLCVDVHSVCRRRSSRGRSPLSLNLCSVYAFITPPYVKNRDPPKQDTSRATDDVVQSKETAELEGEEFFNRNKPNINKPKPKDVAGTAKKTDSSKTTPTIINCNRSPQETFFNSYSILLESPKPPKAHKPRNKRVIKEYSNKNLPNQTKIESFFKRL